MQNKIFGIGLPKTGTTSLNSALKKLGLNSIHLHGGHSAVNKYKKHIWKTGDYKWNGADFDALTNFGEWFFPQLDDTYPNSKFILTVRDKESWLISIEDHFNRRPQADKARIEVFGTGAFNKKRFSYVYDLHEKTVKDYFKGREGDLLIYDICGGDKWNKLCSFLNMNHPRKPFPYTNNNIDREIKVLEQKLQKIKEAKGED